MQWIVLCVATSALVLEISTCRCLPPNPQQDFCEADFALKVKVKSKKHFGPNPNGNFRYHIETKAIYKDSEAFASVSDPHYLWTTDNSASCGLKLRKRKVYAITGFVSLGNLTVNSCQWSGQWHKLTKTQKAGLNRQYTKQCAKCKIFLCSGCQSCYGKSCEEMASNSEDAQPDLCLIRTDLNPRYTCYYRYSICKKKKKSCAFTESTDLTECLSDTQP